MQRSAVFGGIVCWILASVCAACGSGEGEGLDQGTLPDFDPGMCRDSALLADPPASVRHEVHTTNSVNNYVRIDGDIAWVVQSGSNTVGRFVLGSDAFDPNFVDVGQDRNPWDLTFAGGRLYITNFLSDSVSIADAGSGEILGELSDLDILAPGTPATDGQILLVPGTGFAFTDYAPDKVAVLSLREQAPFAQLLGYVEPSGLNSGVVRYDAARDRFYLVSTGSRVADGEGAFVASSEGTLDVWDAKLLREGDLQGAKLASLSFPLQEDDPFAGAPRDIVIAPEGPFGYLPSASSSSLYKVDLDQLQITRNTEDPIEAYEGEGNQLTAMAFRGDGLAYVVAFNQDALYLFDPSCDASVAGPFDLGLRDTRLEGPLHIAYDAPRQRALVLMSISNAVTLVEDGLSEKNL